MPEIVLARKPPPTLRRILLRVIVASNSVKQRSRDRFNKINRLIGLMMHLYSSNKLGAKILP